MAKISIEFDTVEKTASYLLNGKPLDNVVGANMYQRYDDEGKYECSISQRMMDKDNDMMTYMHTIASEKTEDSEETQYEGLFAKKKEDDAELKKEILSYFENK